jgi:DNA replication and repair protein RecF
MIIHSLKTLSFRNLVDQIVEPGLRFNVLFGENAQGKTNFLEAIYLVACLRSFRASRVRELIRFGKERAVVRSRVEGGDLTQDLEVEINPTGRRALLDGKPMRSASSWGVGFNVVLFCPDDLQIPKGSPGARRRMLDRAIANIWSGYITVARDYQKTLTSRNRLLKQRVIDPQQLTVYDQQLAELGAKVITARVRYLKRIGSRFSEVFSEISKTEVAGALAYLAPEGVLDAKDHKESLREVLLGALHMSRAEDRARQVTSVGPHVHDIDFRLDQKTTRSFGSQGQVRALLLAFKITQILDCFERSGSYPVLLLDDVSSELDPQRNSYLFDFLDKISCQTFLTTTRPELVVMKEKPLYFKVVKGKIAGPISLV